MEAMAVESIVSSLWELDGYLTRTRYPVKVDGGYSDVDVVGVDAAGSVRLAECKVRGPARAVYVIEGGIESWLGSWATALDNIPRLWDDRPGWLPQRGDVAGLEFIFYANIWLPTEEARRSADAEFTSMVRARCPKGLKAKASGRVVCTRDLVLDVIEGVRARVVDDRHGKRFGNPVLDAVRELVRYSFPRPHGGGRVGETIQAETHKLITESLAAGE